MKDFDTLFDGKPEDEVRTNDPGTVQELAPEPTGEPQVDPNAPAAPDAEGGEPTSPEHGKSVPLSALEAVRKEKTDWKEKAIRFEEQLRAAQAAQAAPQQPQAEYREPSIEEKLINERFNFSEMVARQKYPDIEEKVNAFDAAMAENPALRAALFQQTNPWDWAYQQGARMLAMQEIGDDPAAFRTRIEEEIRAKVLAEQGQTQQPAAAAAASLPQSLAGARSSAARTAPAHTGPRPFDELFKA